MTAVAEFEHEYPGLFRGGLIGWHYFWALYEQINALRARKRFDSMLVAVYAASVQSGKSNAASMLEDAQKQSAAHEPDPDFVRRLAAMMGESEEVALAYAGDEGALRELLRFHPNAEQYFPEETARARAEWV